MQFVLLATKNGLLSIEAVFRLSNKDIEGNGKFLAEIGVNRTSYLIPYRFLQWKHVSNGSRYRRKWSRFSNAKKRISCFGI